MDPIPPTLPFHLAKAYGLKAAPATLFSKTTPAAPIGPGIDRVDGVGGIRPADKADLATPQKTASIKERLIAAIVPGSVSFGDGIATQAMTAKPATDRLPFYRHPADKNAAATAIDLGSRIDTNG